MDSNRLKSLKIVDNISYFALINAVVFSLFYQFFNGDGALYVCLCSFAVAFLGSLVFCILRIYYAKKDGEISVSKKQVVFLVIKVVINLLLFIFAFYLLTIL